MSAINGNVPSDIDKTNSVVQKKLVINDTIVAQNAKINNALISNLGLNQIEVDEHLVAPEIRGLLNEISYLQSQIKTLQLVVSPLISLLQQSITVDTFNVVPAQVIDTPPLTGRTVTFTNNTGSTFNLWTANNQSNVVTLLVNQFEDGDSYIFNIPDVGTLPSPNTFWSGNFGLLPLTSSWIDYVGITLAEFTFNAPTVISASNIQYRDTFDISNVPPGIGSQFPNGPRSSCVTVSCQAGYKQQQAYGYNVGIQIVPPTSGISPASQTVTANSTNGSSPDSIGFPNDTAVPKQQTILPNSPGNYNVYFTTPVATWPGSRCSS